MKRFQLLAVSVLTLVPQSLVHAQLQFSPVPPRSWGQAKVQAVSGAPNLVEGREMNSPLGLAVDTSSSPPILYIADTYNNRILGYRNGIGVSTGQKADLFIGQADEFSTNSGGPGTASSVGLSRPSGLAVDKSGNLYVADTANNRILRFPKPFAAVDRGDGVFPDMIIGQKSFSSNAPNNNSRNPGADTVGFAFSNAIYSVSMTFDANGNLWTTDPGNLRVLRYPAAALAAGVNGPAADVVLGQSSFTSLTTPSGLNSDSRADRSLIYLPTGLTFDAAGRLYVTDNLVRALVYAPSGGTFQNNQQATRVVGVVKPKAGDTPTVSEYTLGTYDQNGGLSPQSSPQGVFTNGNTVFILDSGANRILRYDPYEQWPAGNTTTLGPPAKAVYGQAASDFKSARPNGGQPDPTSTGLNFPSAAVLAAGKLFVADSRNNRVLVFDVDGGGNPASSASAVLGQLGFSYGAPNLIEGREMFVFNGYGSLTQYNLYGQFSDGGGVVVDTTSNPPRLYVADTYNHRVLGFKDARNVRAGDKADLVIGQTDLMRALINSPANDTTSPTERGLYLPSSVAIDADGNLWIVDSGNGRVLRYPKPFASSDLRPNLVLGQQNFTSKITDATSRTMSRPFGLAFTSDGSALVSDAVHNRVLFFRKPAGADFRNGQAAERVIGQADFTATATGTADSRFQSPREIATDSEDRLYVCDPGNGRVTIFDKISNAGNDPSPATSIGNLYYPHGVFVSRVTGEIWVTNTYGNTVQRYLNFSRLITQKDPDTTIPVVAPLALTLDGFGNLIVLEGLNRLSFFFPGANGVNAASYTGKALSPGVIAALYPTAGGKLSDDTAAASSLPLSTTLADVQMFINDQPVPLFYVSPGQINFLTPMNIATSGTANFYVSKASTGQILATGQLRLAPYTPSLFALNGQGTGQVAALNQDNTVNSSTNPIRRGDVIVLYGTGQGTVKNAPSDGDAASGAVSTDTKPQVLIGTTIVPADSVLYSGLAPGFPGVWQINVKVPDLTAPGSAVPVVVIMGGSYASNDTGVGNNKISTTIAVKDR